MKRTVLLAISLALLAIPLAFSASTGSTNYDTSIVVGGGGTDDAASDNYKTSIVSGQIITGSPSSTNYRSNTGFSYTTEVAAQAAAAAEAPSGDAGGGAGPERRSFEVIPSSFRIELLPGQTKVQEMSIRNTGSQPLEFSIKNDDLQDLVLLNIYEFSLANYNDEQMIKVAFTGSKEGLFEGDITVVAGSLAKTVPLAINVSKKPLFDIKTDVLTKEVGKGEPVKASIAMLNFGELPVDVYLNYSIKDEGGEIIEGKYEMIAVPLNRIVERELPAPDMEGGYFFHAEIYYGDERAESEDSFRVVFKEKVEEKPAERYSPLEADRTLLFIGLLGGALIVIVLLIVIIMLLVLILMRKGRGERRKRARMPPAPKPKKA